MSWSDYQRLKKNLHNTDAISFIVTKNMSTIKANKRTIDNISIRGVTHDYIKISQFAFQAGRYFSPIEAENGRNVCVLGASVAVSLFDRGPYIGQTVTIDGKPLKVIGVIAKQGKNLFGDNQDEFFLMPFATFSNMFNINQRRIDKLIAVKSVNYEKFAMVENDVISLIRLNRGLKPGVEDNFSINKQESLMSEMGRFFKYLNTGGVVISIFSLIIGGFGIANIMFVSVRERTKEIGIQKSLGATRGFILLQFLMESVMLCVIGGIIGLIFLFSIAGLMGFAVKQIGMNMEVVILPQDILLALGLSVAIGLASGILPSMMAARLNPVDAMRVS
jgi:putative ABC transport system permease protein